MVESPTIRVLMTEDDEVDRLAFERLVKKERLPYEYTISTSIAGTKKILAKQQFDVAVLDYLLGDGTAFELFEQLNETPIIIATGSGDEGVAVKAMKEGAYDYLIKDPEHNYLTVLPVTIEKAIQRQHVEKRLEMLFHAVMSTADSIYITDKDDTIIFVNTAFCDTYGYTENEIIGKKSSVLIKQKPGTETQKELEASPKGKKEDSIHVTKNGTEFPVSLTSSIIKDEEENEISYVCVSKDISERLETEKTRLMALFTELNPAPTLRFDREGNVIMANQAANHVFADKSIIGTPVSTLFEGVDKSTFTQCIETGEIARHTVEIDDKIFDLVIRGVPELEIGHIYGNDITMRKQLQEELLQRQRMATIGQTIAGVAHCMKNIVTSINGGIDILKDATAALDWNSAKHALNMLQTSSTKLYLLLMNMLDYSKHRTPYKEKIDLRETFSEICLMLESDAGKAGIDIQCEVGEEAKTCFLDPQLLFRTLLNLGCNALDSMSEGGTLILSASKKSLHDLNLCEEEIPIQAEISPSEECLIIEVCDTGRGIPEDEIPHIFEPLYTTKGAQGTGLGLATVRHSVEEQGGVIHVDSVPQEGTTFRVIFPETAQR